MDQSPNTVTELVANLDDITPELLASAVEQLLDAGALDVWTTPINMKKGRPATMLSMLCHTDKTQHFANLIIHLTGSFGVRYHSWDRLTLQRRHETLQTPFGPIHAKIGSLNSKIITAKCEFDDVAAAAEQHNVPARQVLNAAQTALQQFLNSSKDANI